MKKSEAKKEAYIIASNAVYGERTNLDADWVADFPKEELLLILSALEEIEKSLHKRSE